MKDRELLELAAMAAGYDTTHSMNAERILFGIDALLVREHGRLVTTGWNPLIDDGDALRLAVKLCIFRTTEEFGVFQSFYSDEISRDQRPTAATRRAIVSIAAEFGRLKTPNLNGADRNYEERVKHECNT